VILAQLIDLVVILEVAFVAIFPDVATAGIKERVVPPAIRELDMVEASRGHDGLGLKDWLEGYRRKKQSDEGEDRLGVNVNSHVIVSSSEVSVLPRLS
jgi:hypothetical protein